MISKKIGKKIISKMYTCMIDPEDFDIDGFETFINAITENEVSKYQIASEVYDEYFASQPYPMVVEYPGDILSFSQFLDRMKRLQREGSDGSIS